MSWQSRHLCPNHKFKKIVRKIVVTHLVDEEIIPSSEDTEEIVRGERALTGEEILQLAKAFRVRRARKRARSKITIGRVGV